jgi:hypothetical protein
MRTTRGGPGENAVLIAYLSEQEFAVRITEKRQSANMEGSASGQAEARLVRG